MAKNNRDYNYFESFYQVGIIAKESAEYLKNALKDYDRTKIDEFAQSMHLMENNADAKKHELCNHLAHEFIPPIEREDISALAQCLDNVVDSVEDVMRRLHMFNIKVIRKEAYDFAALISFSCNTLTKLLGEFSNFKKSKVLHDYVVEINTIENKGDKLHADSILRLYSDGTPATEQLSWTMIFEAMENSLDASENCADLIESIITKNI